jgi:hypothetical protein
LVFDHVPTSAELKDLGIVDQFGELNENDAQKIQGKWKAFLESNPAPDMTPNPTAAISYDSLIADGVSPDAARRTLERMGIPVPSSPAAGKEPIRGKRIIKMESGPTPGQDGDTGQ